MEKVEGDAASFKEIARQVCFWAPGKGKTYASGEELEKIETESLHRHKKVHKTDG